MGSPSITPCANIRPQSTYIFDGLAASIASVIAMAGDTVSMAENALMMIHNPFGWVGGEADDMRRTADMLDKATEAILWLTQASLVIRSTTLPH